MTMEKFTVKNGKQMRFGFTTGSCASAAACGAAYMLLTGTACRAAEILLPGGEKVLLPVTYVCANNEDVICSVRKDGGDDPDVTDGAEILARVSRTKVSALSDEEKEKRNGKFPILWKDLTLLGGEGVGLVTVDGLRCRKGEPAINPIPRRMIFENVDRVRKSAGRDVPLTIEISVPEGKSIAQKTYNPRLGIIGGISILGTTGIVDPMSEKALVDTIKMVIDQKFAENPERILIAPGNYGREFCQQELGLELEQAAPVSNYLGEALDYIRYKGFKEILLVGHTGKLIKTAAGIMNTHSSYADGRMEIIGIHSVLCGADQDTAAAIMKCVSTDAAFDLLRDKPYYEQVKESILTKVLYHLRFRLRNECRIQVVMLTSDRSHIIKSEGAEQLIEAIRKDGTITRDSDRT